MSIFNAHMCGRRRITNRDETEAETMEIVWVVATHQKRFLNSFFLSIFARDWSGNANDLENHCSIVFQFLFAFLSASRTLFGNEQRNEQKKRKNCFNWSERKRKAKWRMAHNGWDDNGEKVFLSSPFSRKPAQSWGNFPLSNDNVVFYVRSRFSSPRHRHCRRQTGKLEKSH